MEKTDFLEYFNSTIQYKVKIFDKRKIYKLKFSEIVSLILKGDLLGEEKIFLEDSNDWVTLFAHPIFSEIFLMYFDGILTDHNQLDTDSHTNSEDLLEITKELETRVIKKEFDSDFRDSTLVLPPDPSDLRGGGEVSEVGVDDMTIVESPVEPTQEEKILFYEKDNKVNKNKNIISKFQIRKKDRSDFESKIKTVSATSKNNRIITIISILVIVLIIFEIFDFLDKNKLDPPNQFEEFVFEAKFPVSSPQGDPIKSSQLTLKSESLLRSGKMTDNVVAARYLLEAAQLDPTSGKAFALLSIAYSRLLSFSRSRDLDIGIIYNLIEISQRSSASPSLLIAARSELFLNVGQQKTSLELLDNYRKIEELGWEHLYVWIRALIQEDRSEEAITFIARLKEDVMPLPFRLYLAIAYLQRGDWGSAETLLLDILSRDSNYGAAEVHLAELYMTQGKWGDAKKYSDKAKSHWNQLYSQEKSILLDIQSRFYVSDNKFLEAIELEKRALALDDQNNQSKNFLESLQKKYPNKSKWLDQFSLEMLGIDKTKHVSALIKGSDLDSYAGELIKLLDEYSEISEVQYRIGDLFYNFGFLDSARDAYRNAFNLHTSNSKYFFKYIDLEIKSYDLESARQSILKYAGNLKNKSDFYFYSALIYEKNNDLDNSSKNYRECIKIIGLAPNCYFGLYRISKKLNRFSEAEAFLRKAIESDPLDVKYKYEMGHLISETQNKEVAIGYLNEQLRSMPGNTLLITGIAELYYQIGDTVALNQYLKILEQSDSKNWQYAKLLIERSANNSDEQKKYLKIYSDLNIEDPSGYLERARLFLEDANYDSAKNELEKVERRVSRWPGLQLEFAKLYLELGNNEEAISRVKREILTHPQSPDAYAMLGMLSLRAGNENEALVNYQKALELNPNHFEALLGQAQATRKRGSPEGAIHILRKAQSLDPENPRVYRELGYSYQEAGKYKFAKEALENYLRLDPSSSDREEVLQKLNSLK